MNATNETNAIVTTGAWDVKFPKVIIISVCEHVMFDVDFVRVKYKVVSLNGDVAEFDELVPREGDFELPLVAKEDAK